MRVRVYCILLLLSLMLVPVLAMEMSPTDMESEPTIVEPNNWLDSFIANDPNYQLILQLGELCAIQFRYVQEVTNLREKISRKFHQNSWEYAVQIVQGREQRIDGSLEKHNPSKEIRESILQVLCPSVLLLGSLTNNQKHVTNYQENINTLVATLFLTTEKEGQKKLSNEYS